MGKALLTKAAKQPIAAAPTIDETSLDAQAPPIDTYRARRAIPRDAAVVAVLHTTLHEAVHLHDPIDPLEADRIFSQAVKGLTDQMLLPILTSDRHVLEGGDLTFQCDTEPVPPSSDRHASTLVRRRVKRCKQGYAAAVKTSIYGKYAPSRASSRTESRFGGSRFGGSRASASVRGASKMPKMSLIYGLDSGGESLMDAFWLGSQQGSTGTASNNASWLPGSGSIRKTPSPPASVADTARVAVDFVELQRRADIERDLSTRESLRRSNDEILRKSDLRLKLRSLVDPIISLEKEEAMTVALGAKGQRSRLQQSRQGTRGKALGIPQNALSPLNGKRVGAKGFNAATLASSETTTFRTEDYEGLASDVVLLGKRGELLVGKNCFVVEQKLRQELLLDLHTRGVVQPRIQLVQTPKPEEETTSPENSPGTTQQQSRSPPPTLRPQGAPFSTKQEIAGNVFGGQIGSFESTPILALNLQATPLAKGVVLKLHDGLVAQAASSKNRNAVPRQTLKKTLIAESVPNATLEKKISTLIKAPNASKRALATSQSDSVLQTYQALPADIRTPSAPSIHFTQTTNLTGGESPVLPKHIHNGERHLQSLRIRTPAYPNRLSRKTPSRGSMFMGDDDDDYGWGVDGTENLFSLHKQHSSTSSLPHMKYVREFTKPPLGRIQLHGSMTQDAN